MHLTANGGTFSKIKMAMSDSFGELVWIPNGELLTFVSVLGEYDVIVEWRGCRGKVQAEDTMWTMTPNATIRCMTVAPLPLQNERLHSELLGGNHHERNFAVASAHHDVKSACVGRGLDWDAVFREEELRVKLKGMFQASLLDGSLPAVVAAAHLEQGQQKVEVERQQVKATLWSSCPDGRLGKDLDTMCGEAGLDRTCERVSTMTATVTAPDQFVDLNIEAYRHRVKTTLVSSFMDGRLAQELEAVRKEGELEAARKRVKLTLEASLLDGRLDSAIAAEQAQRKLRLLEAGRQQVKTILLSSFMDGCLERELDAMRIKDQRVERIHQQAHKPLKELPVARVQWNDLAGLQRRPTEATAPNKPGQSPSCKKKDTNEVDSDRMEKTRTILAEALFDGRLAEAVADVAKDLIGKAEVESRDARATLSATQLNAYLTEVIVPRSGEGKCGTFDAAQCRRNHQEDAAQTFSSIASLGVEGLGLARETSSKTVARLRRRFQSHDPQQRCSPSLVGSVPDVRYIAPRSPKLPPRLPLISAARRRSTTSHNLCAPAHANFCINSCYDDDGGSCTRRDSSLARGYEALGAELQCLNSNDCTVQTRELSPRLAPPATTLPPVRPPSRQASLGPRSHGNEQGAPFARPPSRHASSCRQTARLAKSGDVQKMLVPSAMALDLGLTDDSVLKGSVGSADALCVQWSPSKQGGLALPSALPPLLGLKAAPPFSDKLPRHKGDATSEWDLSRVDLHGKLNERRLVF
jgi:hypothetical protein